MMQITVAQLDEDGRLVAVDEVLDEEDKRPGKRAKFGKAKSERRMRRADRTVPVDGTLDLPLDGTYKWDDTSRSFVPSRGPRVIPTVADALHALLKANPSLTIPQETQDWLDIVGGK